MDAVRLFLGKFANLASPDTLLKETIKKIIQEKFGWEIASKDIQITPRGIYLQVKPIFKSELMLHRQELEETLLTQFKTKHLLA